nr:TIGR00366 family protein [Halomicroarcula sp. SYNS111]
MLDLLRRFGGLCSDLSEEYIPDPYVIAILLTFIASTAALLTGAGPRETLVAWNKGVWTLLPFMASIAVLLMAGDAIAKSPKFTSQLEKLARIPNSQFTAVWFVGFVAMAAALVSWAIGLIVGAIMAKRVAYECREKGITVHYPLLAAAGYTSLMIYHGGLTSSVSLMMADSTLIPTAWAPEFRQMIPLSETIGSTANIVTTGTLLAVIPVVMGLLHPKDGITQLPRPDFKEIDKIVHAADEKPTSAVTADGGRERFADRLNDSRLIGLAIALFPAFFVLNAWVLTPGGVSNLTLNSINALFITLAVLLWVRPMALVDQMKQSVGNVSGVISSSRFMPGSPVFSRELVSRRSSSNSSVDSRRQQRGQLSVS